MEISLDRRKCKHVLAMPQRMFHDVQRNSKHLFMMFTSFRDRIHVMTFGAFTIS